MPRWVLAACALLVCTCARAQISVDESRTHAKLIDGKTTITVEFRSFLDKPVNCRLELEWLDPDGVVRGRIEKAPHVSPAVSSSDVEFPLPHEADPLVLRLRYALRPELATVGSFMPVNGIIAFPQIADYVFGLRSLAVDSPVRGKPYQIRVIAQHPVTGLRIAGVTVEVEKQSAITDVNGIAAFAIKEESEEKRGNNTRILGTLGDVAVGFEQRVYWTDHSTIRIQTDKPLYQTGQTLHVRLLATGSDDRASVDKPLKVEFRDEGGALVHSAELATSRFGIASTDWEIPSNASPGKYTIEATGEDGREEEREIEIRRYELPSFRVSVQPDRPYYLPAQTATVDVRADYLFGKPVESGKVRITKADEDDALAEGVLDSSSRFQAKLDLKEASGQLLGENSFTDLTFVAYVTDASTNRTEQRRFDVRLSLDPLHIYLIRGERSETSRPFYITTYTPDGNPAACDVGILQNNRVLGSGHANRYGLARVEAAVAEDDFTIRAQCPNNIKAENNPTLRDSRAKIRLDTSRVLYRRLEPVECEINADQPDARVAVLAWSNGAVLYSQDVQLQNGRAHLTIPYQTGFERHVSIAAVESGEDDNVATRSILYPHPNELLVSARPGLASYRPGEEATLSLHADTSARKPVEAAFGIAIIDRGVLERAETDQIRARGIWADDFSRSEQNIDGITWSDLANLDPSKIDADLELVAEALAPEPDLARDGIVLTSVLRTAFRSELRKSLAPVESLLDRRYMDTLRYPRSEAALQAMYYSPLPLDPWGRAYQFQFAIEGPNHVIQAMSSGPDKKFGTADDLEAARFVRRWFAPAESLIVDALSAPLDYPSTADALYDALMQAGINLRAIKDPWGNVVRGSIEHRFTQRIVKIKSAGPDGQFDTGDDFTVIELRGAYFQARTNQIETILRSAAKPPANAQEFYDTLSAAGLDLRSELDPWGHPYDVTVGTESRFDNRIQIYTQSDYPGPSQLRKVITPAKLMFREIRVSSRGSGESGVLGRSFDVAQFSRLLEPNPPQTPLADQTAPAGSAHGTATITGAVMDLTGAVISGAEVRLDNGSVERTDGAGRYTFHDVAHGMHVLHFSARGFESHLMNGVPAVAGRITVADAVLQVGSVSEMVSVTAPTSELKTVNAEVGNAQMGRTASTQILSTPRVREYFPETLYWEPELISDASGRARVKFKLADSITTWRVGVVASTEDGLIAESSTDLRAFQPFFVDLDPPPVLTAGDEVTLPIPIRNYLSTDELVKVEVAAPASLSIFDSPRQPQKIEASSSANASIGLRAASAPATAKLRITARARNAADAIEKPIAIHPDGEAVSAVANDLVQPDRALKIDIPAAVLPGSVQAEVKIYPALIAHLAESMESMLMQPNGCGEQTISLSYPNLLFLKVLKRAGVTEERLQKRARHNLEMGYEKLLGFQTSAGGFAYWSNAATPDAALTAYAISFLEDAREFLAVDPDVLGHARDWLSKQVNKEGAPAAGLSVHALALGGERFRNALIDQLSRLARDASIMDDPYAIATFALAALDVDQPDLARPQINRLRTLAQNDRKGLYWNLKSNTPFHGWGRAGQIESTAITVLALIRWNKREPDAELKGLADQGMAFLLGSKDAAGLWLSSQATVRVFQALMEGLEGAETSKPFTADVVVNGANVAKVTVAPEKSFTGPVVVDVARWIKPGQSNDVRIVPPAKVGAQAQFNASWYQPWAGAQTSPDLDFSVQFQGGDTSPNELVRCTVSAARKVWRGYGMLIAEVGLPPGADVDRGALTDLIARRGSGVSSFEVAPDRVVFYLESLPGGSHFEFTFRPRYPIRAQSERSVLYDYYNPDARVTLPPVAFTVK